MKKLPIQNVKLKVVLISINGIKRPRSLLHHAKNGVQMLALIALHMEWDCVVILLKDV